MESITSDVIDFESITIVTPSSTDSSSTDVWSSIRLQRTPTPVQADEWNSDNFQQTSSSPQAERSNSIQLEQTPTPHQADGWNSLQQTSTPPQVDGRNSARLLQTPTYLQPEYEADDVDYYTLLRRLRRLDMIKNDITRLTNQANRSKAGIGLGMMVIALFAMLLLGLAITIQSDFDKTFVQRTYYIMFFSFCTVSITESIAALVWVF